MAQCAGHETSVINFAKRGGDDFNNTKNLARYVLKEIYLVLTAGPCLPASLFKCDNKIQERLVHHTAAV